LERLIDLLPDERPTIYGLLASTEKRQAEVLYSTAKMAEQFPTSTKEYSPEMSAKDKADSVELLRTSCDHYSKTFMFDRARSWAVVQYLSLNTVLARARNRAGAQEASQSRKASGRKKSASALGLLARLLSRYDIYSDDRDRAICAHSNLAELYLLSLAMPDAQLVDGDEARRQALEHIDALIETAPRDSFYVYSTRRQMFRYLEWYGAIADLSPLTGLAEMIFDRLPADVEDRWK
jgi:hypothetical protein